MFFRPSLFDVIADYARWHRMVLGLTPSKWMVLCLGHLIPCHTMQEKMLEGVGSYSFFCEKKFLEKIFGKWCAECEECEECCFY